MTEQTELAEMSENVRKCQGAKSRLSEKQLMAIELLLRGHSIDDIASATGVTPRTVYRWRENDLFCERLSERRKELWSHSADRLVGMVEPALDVLRRQLRDNHERLQFRSANAILRIAQLGKAIRER